MHSPLELHDLAPEPQEAWQRMLRFVAWSKADRVAASQSVEAIFRRGPQIVEQTYDYLRHVPETAAVLGWEQGPDPAHLEERRRFFTLWLARTLGLDTSDEFAAYLFWAGKAHAGHGPRHIHTPAEYVIGSLGLVLAAFARVMAEAGLAADVVAGAMGAWSKYLMVQQHQMLLGYQVACDLVNGPNAVRCTLFGRLRPLVGAAEIRVHTGAGSRVGDALRKVFNYYPQVRAEALERVWCSEERPDALWVETIPVYTPRHGWRVLLNGRDVQYVGGFDTPVQVEDEIAIFPPGR